MPLSKKNIRLIKSSIAHWKRMRDNKPRKWEEPDAGNCALCRAYMFDNDGSYVFESCRGCPIKEFKKIGFCKKTPFEGARVAYLKHGFGSSEFTKAAQDEIAFLESFLRNDDNDYGQQDIKMGF